MTIEVKIAKNGRINAKVNGKCVAINTLSELVGKSLRNNEQVELIASDGHKFTCTGYELYEFAHPLCRRDSFNFMDDAGNTFPADTMTEAIYTVDKFASGEYKTRNIFAEYTVSAMAQEIATKAEIENAQANDEPVTPTVEPADYTPQVAEWIDPHQYGEHGNLEQPRDISVYCNEPATNVTADEDTVFAAYEAAINGDRAYVLKAQELFTAHTDGDTLRSFQLAYNQDRKQYGENISQALRALGDNRSEGYNEKLQSLIDTWDAESNKVLTVNKTIFNQRLIEALIQKFDERENAQANDVKVTEQDNSNVTIDDNGKIFDSAKVTIDQAVNIISRLNYRNDTFQYRFTTREDNADIKYRHFDAYRQNGDKDAFAISEIVINGKLEIVRFFNLFRDIIVDLHIGNLNCKLGYKGAIEIVDDHNAQFLADKIARDVQPSESDNVFDLLPDFSRRAQIVAEHREYLLDSQEDELRDAEERTIAIPIRTKIDKKGRLSVKYGDVRVTLQAAVENAIYDYRHEPITVINQYGEKFSHTAHIGQRHLGHARDILALHVRDLATLKPLPEVSDEVIARRRNERIGRDLYFDKIFRESKPCDTPDEITDISRYSPTYDTRNAFDLLPTLDELNDVDDDDALIDEHAPQPSGIYDDLLNTPVTEARIEELADAINDNRDAYHEADFMLTVAERNGDTLRAAELKTFMDGCIADAYQLNNALDNLIKPHTPPTVESDTVIFAKNIAEYFVGHNFHFDFAEIVNGRLKHHFADYRYGDRFIETYTDATPSKLLYATEIIPLAYGSCNYVLNDFTALTRDVFGHLASVEAAERAIEDKNPIIEPDAYTPQVTAWQDPHQYGTPGNLEHVRRTDITEFNAHIGDDIVTYINGKFYGVHSLKYGAYYEIVDGEPRFWTNPYHLNSDKFDFRDADRWDEEDWFDIMVTRGACIIGEPADDFNKQLAELTAAAKAAHDAEKNAMHELDKACDTYHKAEETWRQARLHMRDAEFAVEQFLAGKAKELRDNLLDDDIFNGKIAIIAQGGKRFDEPELGQIWIDVTPDQKFLINSCTKFFATYDTPAQVTAAVELLRDAIKRGDSEFAFLTIGELNKPTTANEWRTVRTKTNPRNVNLTVQNKARANA